MTSSVPSSSTGADPVGDPVEWVDPAPRPLRRSFTAAYRARVVAEYDAAPHGEKSAVLRREGLYQSQVAEWSAARDALARGARPSRQAHRSSKLVGGDGRETERLRRENARLSRELAKSAAVVEIMGKLQGLLETISESTGTPPPPTTR
jgi:transposase